MYSYLNDTAIEWIPEKSRVLDLGTGDGSFLAKLVDTKRVTAEGVEKDAEMVARCIELGLVVHQGDLLDGLDQYDDGSFDVVLLMGTFQELVSPQAVIKEAFRVAKKVFVAYHNFAYMASRFQLLFSGKVPVTISMPHRWYDSPNIHFCSILDFQDMCSDFSFRIEKSAHFNSRGPVHFFPNFRSDQILSVLTDGTKSG